MSSVLFILFILIIFRVSNNDIGQINDNDNYFCEKRIYDQGSNFTASEINEICKIISKDDRFIIRFPKKYFIDEKLYLRDNKESFTSLCDSLNENMCDNGYGISVFNNDFDTLCVYSQIFEIKEKIKEEINDLITSIQTKYSKDNSGIDIMKFLLKSIKENDPIDNPSSITIKNNTLDNSNQKISYINPIVLIIIIIIPLGFVCIVIYSVYKINKPETIFAPYMIHDYFTKVKTCYKKIKASKEKQISIDRCILCLEKIVPHYHKMEYEMKDLPLDQNSQSGKELLLSNKIEIPIDDMNIRFVCGHVYHNTCLHRSKIEYCIMCLSKEENLITVTNTNSLQIINESHIIHLLTNFNKIYNKDDLSHYSRVYDNELEKAKDKFITKQLEK